jgi:hypothetical protein
VCGSVLAEPPPTPDPERANLHSWLSGKFYEVVKPEQPNKGKTADKPVIY